ncbi:MAG: SDR family oxidoreductase [Pseudomonadota bacterium]
MRVLVTGCTGLLGSSLLPWLQHRGYDVCGVARRGGGAHAADLTIFPEALRLLEEARPDCIVNLAAMANVDECEIKPAEAYRVNAGLVLNLVRWVESTATQCRLVQISTDQVYDGEGPHAEEHVSPLNYYAYSKCLAEEYVKRIGGISLRTNFFGRSARQGRASLSDWVIDSVRAGRSITVFDDVFFSPLSIQTLIESIETVINSSVSGVFNLGSREGLSKAEFAQRLTQAAALQTPHMRRGSISSLRQVARRPGDMRMQVSAFERALGVQLPALNEEIAIVGRGYKDATS